MKISILNKVHLLIVICILPLFACKDDNSNNKEANAIDVINQTMEEWYLWNNQLPTLNSELYSNVNLYFKDLLVENDKWSYIANRDALFAFLRDGTYTGYGVSFKYDQENNLRVKLIFEASPLYSKGITRGWKLVRINNTAVASLTEEQALKELEKPSSEFVLENNTGEQKNISASQKVMDQNSILKRKVIDYQGKKVAYLAFNSFLVKSKEELNETFSYFKEQKAVELVLDLRYNGGGSIDIANQLASLITGNAYVGEVFSKTFYNDLKNDNDSIIAFKNEPAAYAFKRVFVITTKRTASASEMVINSLKPYMGSENVILIGSKTHGKPVGMHVFENKELNLAIVPITFKIANIDDYGDYFEGIPVDYEISDDLSHDFGSIEESNFKAALSYITNESFPAITLTKSSSTSEREFSKKGLDELIDAN